MESQSVGVDFGKSQQEERFFIISVEVEFHFLAIGYHTNSQHVQYVVQASNSTEAFSGLTGTDMQESIMSVSVMSIAMFVIQMMKDMD